MAVCKVKDGKVEARCITPPQAAKESDDTLKAWVLGQVLGRPLRVEDIRLDRQMKDVLQKDQCEDPDKRLSDILKRGQYFNPAKRELIRFRLPAGK